MENLNKSLIFSPEVKEAMVSGKPIVALESTIISHGMPYPKNVETAIAVEQIIRDNGAVPATIAIIKGKLMVGLTAEDLEYFGKRRRWCNYCCCYNDYCKYGRHSSFCYRWYWWCS